MAQFVLKTEKFSHIIGARGYKDLRSPSLIILSKCMTVRVISSQLYFIRAGKVEAGSQSVQKGA